MISFRLSFFYRYPSAPHPARLCVLLSIRFSYSSYSFDFITIISSSAVWNRSIVTDPKASRRIPKRMFTTINPNGISSYNVDFSSSAQNKVRLDFHRPEKIEIQSCLDGIPTLLSVFFFYMILSQPRDFWLFKFSLGVTFRTTFIFLSVFSPSIFTRLW